MHTTQIKLPFLTLILMISFASVNGVLFTPSLPNIADYFSISETVAQQTITWFLLGYTFGQLLYGPLANRFGRKPALHIGIGLQIFSSFLCVIAGWLHLFFLLVFGRFLLALGAGVGLKMAFTLVTESYEPPVAAQKISYLAQAFAIAPSLAVAVGGILNAYYGWQSCFYAGAIYGMLLWLLLLKLPETQTHLDYNALKIKHFIASYRATFKMPQLTLGGFLMGTSTAFFYIFAAIGPFIAIELLGMGSAVYGVANLIPALGLLVGAIGSATLVMHYSPKRLIHFGILLTIVGCLWMLGACILHMSALNALFFPMGLIEFGLAFVLPNASVVAMENIADKAHASATMNFINLGTATFLVLSMSYFSVTTLLLPLSLLALCFIMSCFYQILKKQTLPIL